MLALAALTTLIGCFHPPPPPPTVGYGAPYQGTGEGIYIKDSRTDRDVTEGHDTVRDTSTTPSFELDAGDTAYSIEVEILTQSGGATTRSSYTASDVGSVATRFTLAGADLPSPAYLREDVHLAPSFTSDQPLVIPASARGGVLTVHATAVDGNELASNVIDLAIDLK